MKINHLIIGVKNRQESEEFYEQIFGYEKSVTFQDTGTKQEARAMERHGYPLIILVPFSKERLPSPQHIAFEVELDTFRKIQENCKKLKVKMRAHPSLDSADMIEVGETEGDGKRYKNFYFSDPNGVNLELMCLIEPER